MASHGADAFRTMACAYRDLAPPKAEKPVESMRGMGQITVNEFLTMVEGPKGRTQPRV
jgi:hypothetical protein